MDESEIVDVPPDTGKKILEWIKKDWYVVLILVMCLFLLLYAYTNVQGKVDECYQQCNDYYQGEIKRHCPTLTMGNPKIEFTNLTIPSGDTR